MEPSSAAAFDRWLANSHQRDDNGTAAQFAEFGLYLERQGVSGVVPNWQLWRVDAHYAARCGVEFFTAPPEQLWREIVPTLRLLRDQVIPVTGPVEAVSGFRTSEINACVNGASASRHLTYSALDLTAVQMTERRDLFADLCRLHQRVGWETAMGLGTYFDPKDLDRGKAGRFHIDAAGYRTWGFDYSNKSSPCPELI
ncbi:MAG: D-Ala-D-Ala carboxypeptidase family metallohydrolase [Erythrobacter sp.]